MFGSMRPVVTAGLALALSVVLAPAPAAAEGGWEALERPGAVAIMRHAIAPGTGDPAEFRLRDCTTQRNLDARGRAQARAIGRAIRESGVVIDRVLSSQWCRCLETAELLELGPVEEFPALNSFFADRSTRDAQTEETRRFLAGLPDDVRVLLVTHQVNITALTGRGVASGEVFVIDVTADGEVEVLDEILLRP
jgi:phosphohistidine phosphatase SixA